MISWHIKWFKLSLFLLYKFGLVVWGVGDAIVAAWPRIHVNSIDCSECKTTVEWKGLILLLLEKHTTQMISTSFILK